MAESWHEGLPDDLFTQEEDRLYMVEIDRIKKGVDKGMGFDEASALITEKDETLRRNIVADALKVLIADEHFGKGASIEALAEKLKIAPERIEAAKKEMLEEVVGDASMRQYFEELDGGNTERTDA